MKVDNLEKALQEEQKDSAEMKVKHEKLKHQVEKHKEAWEIMCAEKTRRYNELLAEKDTLECEIRYAKMDGKI